MASVNTQTFCHSSFSGRPVSEGENEKNQINDGCNGSFYEVKSGDDSNNDGSESPLGFDNGHKSGLNESEKPVNQIREEVSKANANNHQVNGANVSNIVAPDTLEDFATQVLGHFAGVNTAVKVLSPNQQRDFKLLWTGLAMIKMDVLVPKGLKANLAIVERLIRSIPHTENNRQLLGFLKEVRLVLKAAIEIANDERYGLPNSPTLKKLKEDLASIQPGGDESIFLKVAKFISSFTSSAGVGAVVVATSGVAGAGITAAVTGSSFVATLKFIGTALLTLAKIGGLAIAGAAGFGASIFPPVLIAIASLVVVVGIGIGVNHLYQKYQESQYQKAVEYFTSRDMASDVINYLQSDTSISNATKVAAIIMALDVSDLTPAEISKNTKYTYTTGGHEGFRAAIDILSKIITPDNINEIVNDLTMQMDNNPQLKANKESIMWWLLNLNNLCNLNASKNIMQMRTNEEYFKGISDIMSTVSVPREFNITREVTSDGSVGKDINRTYDRFDPSYTEHVKSTFHNVSSAINLSIIPTKDQVRLLFVSQTLEGNLWDASSKFARGLTNVSGTNEVKYEDLSVEYTQLT